MDPRTSRRVIAPWTLEAVPSTAAWHLSEHIYPLFHDGGMVYLDTRDNRGWLTTNRALGSTILHACNLLSRIRPTWPELAEEPPLHADRLQEVTAAGILSPGPGTDNYNPPLVRRANNPALYAGNLMMSRPRESFSFTAQEVSAAHTALKQAVRTVQLPVADMISQLTAARHQALQAATPAQALRIANAVRQASFDYDDQGRIACLELSAATLLAGCAAGVQIGLQLGTAVDPITPHAWPLAQGQAIQTAYDEPIENKYYPVLTI